LQREVTSADIADCESHSSDDQNLRWRQLERDLWGAVASGGDRYAKVIVTEWMSLDGVVQAPGAADEDTTGGFQHGGWHLRYFEDLSQRWVVENLTAAGGFLFGRRTYERFAAHWPNASGEEQVVAQPLNTKPRYVASRTLTEPLGWWAAASASSAMTVCSGRCSSSTAR
jgi:RibD C-terminal domain